MTPLHPTNLIAIPVPEDAHNFYARDLSDDTEIIFDDESCYCLVEDAPIIEGKFKILGTVTKDTIDFDVADYVGEEAMVIHNQTLLKYPDSDYKNEAFRSLLSANDALFENPYGDEPNHSGFNLTGHPVMDAAIKKNIQWQTAQSKVNKKYVILEKI